MYADPTGPGLKDVVKLGLTPRTDANTLVFNELEVSLSCLGTVYMPNQKITPSFSGQKSCANETEN